MFKEQRAFHPDLQKNNGERPPVSSIWTDLSDNLEMRWMRNENSQLSRREFLGLLFGGSGTAATLGFGAWLTENNGNVQDVFPDGANHNKNQSGGYNMRGAKAPLPTPVPNPTPQGKK